MIYKQNHVARLQGKTLRDAYLNFMSETKKKLKEEQPSMNTWEITAKARAMWKDSEIRMNSINNMSASDRSKRGLKKITKE
eukprot:Skav234437  [mRNA]  locus=scaffold1999:24390:24740:- [translate_table: standard]